MKPRTIHLELNGKLHQLKLGDGEAVIGAPPGITPDAATTRFDAKLLEPGVLSLLIEQPDGSNRSFRCVLDQDAAGTQSVVIAGRRFSFALSDPRSLKTAAAAGAGADAHVR